MSNIGRERRALELFERCCELEEPARSEFIERECGDDNELRSFIARMLETDAREDIPFDGARALADALAQQPGPAPPERIGPYQVIREIGRGGMGVVYECQQDNPRRPVAVKIIRSWLPTKDVLRRFHFEAQILGLLDHPGIAHVYEAGSAQIGDAVCPYLAMEYIDGSPLKAHVADASLDEKERVELVARICDGVQHAHQKGIVHRDLKPANILVKAERSTAAGATALDRIGQPKILDFGIARATDSDLQLTTLQTQAGQLIGTLAYMSPEQVDGRTDLIDTRSDVYAIGVVLYELLSGRRPFDLDDKPISETARIIRDQTPTRLGTFASSLRGDLETIVSKALDKERDRRYASAAEMALDLRRYLRGEPVAAVPPSTLYQVRKFAGRNKALVGGLVATFVALVGGLATTLVLLREVSHQRDDAQDARKQAQLEQRQTERVATFQGQILRALEPDTFGDRVIDILRAEHARATADLDDDARAAAAHDLEQVIAQLNETNIGRDLLGTEIGDRAIEILERGFTDDPAVEATIRKSIANLQRPLGNYDAAVEQYERVVEIRRSLLGPYHALTIDDEVTLASLCVRAGQRQRGLEMLESVAADAKDHLRPGHASLVRAEAHLGRVLGILRRDQEALEILESNLPLIRASQPVLKRFVLNELGVLELRRGDTDRAMALFDQMLATPLGEESDEDPSSVPDAINNIMATLFREGRLEEAERYARRGVATFEELRGDAHPSTILARNNLGRVLFDLGRTEEAAEIWESAYERARALPIGDDTRDATATNLIDARLALGMPSDAESLARELLQERRNAEPPRPPAIAQTLEQLGASLTAQGRLDEALEAERECLQLRVGVAPDHWLTHRARGGVGITLIRLGRVEEGRPLVLASLDGLNRTAGSIPANMRERELTAAHDRVRESQQR